MCEQTVRNSIRRLSCCKHLSVMLRENLALTSGPNALHNTLRKPMHQPPQHFFRTRIVCILCYAASLSCRCGIAYKVAFQVKRIQLSSARRNCGGAIQPDVLASDGGQASASTSEEEGRIDVSAAGEERQVDFSVSDLGKASVFVSEERGDS
jgi:hypothetical protein